MKANKENFERTAIIGNAELQGFLEIPERCRGLVVFAHGSGSSRFSRRNNAVAAYLREARLGTFLFDLLTKAEERVDTVTREHRFNIELLSRRLLGVVRWLTQLPECAGQPIGLFGSSTGAAAALIVAAEAPELVAAVVSRGGRVDLAGSYLDLVKAPTLLLVGGIDTEVLRLNRTALRLLGSAGHLDVVPGATHLFEEPGALEQVADLTRAWFVRHLQDRESTSKRAIA